MSATDDFWDKELTPQERASRVISCAKAAHGQPLNRRRRQRQYVHAALYENTEVCSMAPYVWNASGTRQKTSGVASILSERQDVNHLRSAIDSIHATITRSRPKARFLATGGDWETHLAVRDATQIVAGLWDENEVYETASALVRDSEVMEMGWVHLWHDNVRMLIDRVPTWEVFIDTGCSSYMSWKDVQIAYRHKYVDKDELGRRFGKADEIKAAIKTASLRDNSVETFEVWKKSSEEGTDDGYHAIVIQGCMLFEERWKHPRIDLIPLILNPNLIGVSGNSLAEQAARMQVRLNALVRRRDAAIAMASGPILAVPQTANIPEAKINDDRPGRTLPYSGPNAPTSLSWDPNVAAIQATIDWYASQIHQVLGDSQPFASGQSALGPGASGASINMELKTASLRLSSPQQIYERFFKQLATATMLVARDLYDKNPKLSATAPGRKFAKTVPWKNIAGLANSDFVVRTDLVNVLSDEPTGRRAEISEDIAAGIMTPDEGRAAMRDLDPDADADFKEVAKDYLESIFTKMLKTGKPVPIDPTQDLVQGVPLALKYIQLGLTHNAKPAGVRALRAWLSDANTELNKQKALQAKQAAPPAPSPGAPPAGSPPVPMVNG